MMPALTRAEKLVAASAVLALSAMGLVVGGYWQIRPLPAGEPSHPAITITTVRVEPAGPSSGLDAPPAFGTVAVRVGPVATPQGAPPAVQPSPSPISAGGLSARPPDTGPSANAYSHLYAVMDKYAAGRTLRLLESYEDTPSFSDGNTAWVYDNALVMLALLARGTEEDRERAMVLADSMVYAQSHDPDFADGRLRDAYHASSLLDSHQEASVASPGSGTGNMAWAMLALLRSYEVRGEPAHLQAAERIGQWLEKNNHDSRGPGGFTGGYEGQAPNQTKNEWKATEHNVDAYAAFATLYRLTGKPRWLTMARHAKGLVEAMWDDSAGRFWTGTLTDGQSANPSPIPEDAQSWSLMALGEKGRYGAGIAWAERSLTTNSCPGCEACQGFRFSDRGAGCWWEGTAHMALAFQIKGETEKSSAFLAALRKVQSAAANGNGKGIASACPGGADSGYGGVYPDALHTGATAWFIFAERYHNPFWGIATDQSIPDLT